MQELKIKPAKYAQYKLLCKDKSFEFVVKTPPAAVQLMEAAKLKSGSGEPNRKKKLVLLGNKLELLLKMPDLNAFTLESAMSMVVGTAKSMGITVSGDAPFLIKRQN
jgi:large subunit ribosomal protein L11